MLKSLTHYIAGTRLKYMKAIKDVLIVTDGLNDVEIMAGDIAMALKGSKVSIKTALEFKGNNMLPAEAFFLGCKKPEPETFAYLSDFLKHVNLAGRPCGVFSPDSTKATKYLAKLVKDCEAALNPEHFSDSGADIKRWAKSVVSQK